MYLEYKSGYRLSTNPSIVSNGEMQVTLPPQPMSYFDGSNADLDSATCSAEQGCHITGTTNVAKVLSHETFDNDIVFISEFTNRPMFGGGYQSGLWLFFAPADATLTSISNNDGDFRDYEPSVIRSMHRVTIRTYTAVRLMQVVHRSINTKARVGRMLMDFTSFNASMVLLNHLYRRMDIHGPKSAIR